MQYLSASRAYGNDVLWLVDVRHRSINATGAKFDKPIVSGAVRRDV